MKLTRVRFRMLVEELGRIIYLDPPKTSAHVRMGKSPISSWVHYYIAIIPPFSIAFEESQAGLAELVGTGLLTFLGCGRGLRAWGLIF